MKKIVLFFVSAFWLSVGIAFAESKWVCDTVVTYSQFNNEPRVSNITTYLRDGNGVLICKTDSTIKVDSYNNGPYKTEYYYDLSGNIITEIAYDFSYQNESRSKVECIYDNQNRPTLNETYYWNSTLNDWILWDKTKYVYPTDHSPNTNQWFYTFYHSWDFISNDWSGGTDEDLIENEFENENLISSVFSVRDTLTNNFVKRMKFDYEYYDSGKLKRASSYMPWGTSWSFFATVLFTYDSFGNILSETIEGVGASTRKKTYTYDCSGKKTSYTYYSDFPGPDLTRQEYEEYAYDSNGNKTSRITYKKIRNSITNKDVWDYDKKNEYAYDSNGNLISEIAHYWYWSSAPSWRLTDIKYGSCSPIDTTALYDLERKHINNFYYSNVLCGYQDNGDGSYKVLIYTDEAHTDLVAIYEYSAPGKWINTISKSIVTYCQETSISPSPNGYSALIEWQPNELAENYKLFVYSDAGYSNLVCSVEFDSKGQIIDFYKPAKSKPQTASFYKPAKSPMQITNTTYYSYEIDDLSSATTYYYTLESFGALGELLSEKSNEFTTSESDVTGIVEKDNDSLLPKVVGYYNILGQKLEKAPVSGIYIIQYENGKTKKIIKQ